MSAGPRRQAGEGLWELLKTSAREAWGDDIAGESAKAAYYFFLSLFPAILALFAFTGIFGGREAFAAIMGYLRDAMPGQAANYLEEFVREITGRERPGMLSLGLLLTLWSASNIFGTLAEGLNVMYDLEEGRSFWKRKAISLAAMVAGLALFVGAAAAILAGPSMIELSGIPPIWHVLRWPIAFLLVTALIWLIYYLLPNHEESPSPKWTLVGALCGAGLWTLATLGLRLYVSNFGSYSKTYGVIGGIMVLLLWLYFSAFSVLLGGEVAATLEQRSGEPEAKPSQSPGNRSDGTGTPGARTSEPTARRQPDRSRSHTGL
ncbi:MAG: YihY/virulence factor BrkB family protein [Vicinamibacteria bacterium]